jgi:hypothetical protein
MSIDTLGARAAQDLFDATADLDVERALGSVQHRFSGRRRTFTLLVAACAVLLLIAGWLGARTVLQDRESAPPLDDNPAQVVGSGLSVPAQLSVPDGWTAVRDASTVELRPSDGSDSSITLVGQPVKVYQPPRYRLAPLAEDLMVWTTKHPDLEVSDRFGLDGPGFAWTGTQMTLAVAPSSTDVPLIPLPGQDTPLSISQEDGLFLWDAIYLTDAPPLVIASRSSTPDDPTLKEARASLLQSLQVNTSVTE